MRSVVFGPVPGKHKVSLIDLFPPKVTNFTLALPRQDEERYEIMKQVSVFPDMAIE